jgi:hypothetical protein
MSSERDTQLARLEAELERQQALSDLLLGERAERQAPRAATKRSKPTQAAGDAPPPEGQPTSRRGLLKRLGTSAAGAAVAATALGAARPERAAADAAATIVPASTSQFGIYAANTDVVRPTLPVGVDTGVLGIANATANLTALASTQSSGVAGAANNDTGVVGVAGEAFGLGVGGICGAETPRTLQFTSAGVAGVSPTRTGVSGISGSNHGVFGQSEAPAGTVVPSNEYNPGAGLLAAGLAGRSSSTIALYGFTDGPPNPNIAPVGAVGQCQNGFGVWGLSSAGPGAASRPGGPTVSPTPIAISGVLGTSASGLGVYAISSGAYALAADGNGPSTVGALLRGLGGGKAAVCVGDVEIQGNLHVTGATTHAPATGQTDSRSPAPATLESPEPLVAVGGGQLTAGRAEVRLDPAFAAALTDDQYHVFLTEYGDHSGLYVSRRTRESFEVRAKDSPTAGGTFSYRVVGRPRSAQAAADRTPTPLHVPTLPTPQGVPTLPVGRETPPPSAGRGDRD